MGERIPLDIYKAIWNVSVCIVLELPLNTVLIRI